jgi:ribosomal peptide maturation radical SAM protein 1
MTYRSKSPARVLAELDSMASRYGVKEFGAVDNIMDLRYLREVFPVLAAQHKDYRFFYEVKANLTQEQVAIMARGGMRAIQPGIESLSTHVLKLMRKGVTGIQNVRLLKSAYMHGITVAWNLLVGFPGERPEDYERQLATMRLIPHLPPAYGLGRIWLERFSPNFTEAAELGFVNIRPDRAYACVYPPGLDFARIAYFFEYDAPDTLPDEQYAPMREQVRRWRQGWQQLRRPYLYSLRADDVLKIVDGREPGEPQTHVFDRAAAHIYEFCAPNYHSAAQVLEHLRQSGVPMQVGDVQRHLDTFAELGLMLEEDGLYLSLALPASVNWLIATGLVGSGAKPREAPAAPATSVAAVATSAAD